MRIDPAFQLIGTNYIDSFFIVTPTTCKKLIDAGYEVTVERSTQRIFEGTIENIATDFRINF